jgi:hypothetical protein
MSADSNTPSSSSSAIGGIVSAASDFSEKLIDQGAASPGPDAHHDGITEQLRAGINSVAGAAQDLSGRLIDSGALTPGDEKKSAPSGGPSTSTGAPVAPNAPDAPLKTPALGAEGRFEERAPRVPVPVLPLGEEKAGPAPAVVPEAEQTSAGPGASTHTPAN